MKIAAFLIALSLALASGTGADAGYTFNGDLTTRSNSHSGVSFAFDANAYGQPRAVKNAGVNYVTGALYHENGLIESATYLNGHALTQSLTSRQKPYVLKTAKPGGANAVWRTHSYDVRGKLSSVLDSDGVAPSENRSFTYDGSGRLLTASGPWGPGNYVYDALGNLRSWTQGATTATTGYDAATNRVASYLSTGQPVRAFAYDARGNTAGNGNHAFAYDPGSRSGASFANQPTAVTGVAAYAYDGNFKRVKETRAGKTVYTVYSRLTGGLVYRDQATDNVKTDYVSMNDLTASRSGGGAALRLKKTGAGPVVPEYTHFDHLGSAVAATDAAGLVLWRESYTPFGGRRLKPAANDNNTGFTGHLEDDETGLAYMQARLMDPLIGRFYSTDPIGYQDQLNLYAYVRNDPINSVDPDGTCTGSRIEGDGGLCAGNHSFTAGPGNGDIMPSKGSVQLVSSPDDTRPDRDQASRAGEETMRGPAGQSVGAAKDLSDAYDEMRDTGGREFADRDKAYHCIGNCKAAQRGPYGEEMARRLSDRREERQMSRDPADSARDQEANLTGRRLGRDNPTDSCYRMCGESYSGGNPAEDEDSS